MAATLLGLLLLLRGSGQNLHSALLGSPPPHRLGVGTGMGRHPSYRSERGLHLGRVAAPAYIGELAERVFSRMDPGANPSTDAPDALGMAELQNFPRLGAHSR